MSRGQIKSHNTCFMGNMWTELKIKLWFIWKGRHIPSQFMARKSTKFNVIIRHPVFVTLWLYKGLFLDIDPVYKDLYTKWDVKGWLHSHLLYSSYTVTCGGLSLQSRLIELYTVTWYRLNLESRLNDPCYIVTFYLIIFIMPKIIFRFWKLKIICYDF